MSDYISKSALVDALTEKAKNMAEVAANSCGQAIDYYSGMKTGFSSAAIMANSAPTIDAVPREDYEATIYAREQNAYDRGLLDGRKSAPWNVITKRPMTAEERTEWEEHIGAMLFDEEAFLYGNLPEYDKECLVCSKWGRIFIDTLQDDEDCCCSWENDGDMESIIAWMPLPEPYKAERSEE